MRKYEAQVMAGVAWLDERIPDWRSGINWGELDMSNCLKCIAGQVGGHYEDFIFKRGLTRAAAAELGFDIAQIYGSRSHQLIAQQFFLLRDEWMRHRPKAEAKPAPTAEQILKNVQSKIADKINDPNYLGDPIEANAVSAFLEWIDREISKAIEDREAE